MDVAEVPISGQLVVISLCEAEAPLESQIKRLPKSKGPFWFLFLLLLISTLLSPP